MIRHHSELGIILGPFVLIDAPAKHWIALTTNMCGYYIYISTISLIWCPDTNSKLCWFVGFCATFRTIEYVKGCESFNDLHATDNMHTPKCATKVGFLMDQVVMMIWIKLSFGNNISINQTLLNICLWSPFIIVHYDYYP